MSWKAIHIFYYDNQDMILREGINAIMMKNQIENYFFIRYWENGPHIRLRMKDISEEVLGKVKSEIRQFIEDNESKVQVNKDEYRKMAQEFSKKENITADNMELIGNNTIKDWQYIPELEKYNGIEGVKIAEKEFVYSSKLVLLLLQTKPSQAKKYFLSAVFACMLIHYLYTENSEKEIFLEKYIKYWKYFTGYSEEALKRLKDNTEKYPVSVDALRKVKEFYENQFLAVLHKEVFSELKELVPDNAYILERFCFNFIHLFNNRIGMSPAEEVIMGYLGIKMVKEGGDRCD